MEDKPDNIIFIGKKDPLRSAIQGLEAISNPKACYIFFEDINPCISELKDYIGKIGSIGIEKCQYWHGESTYDILKKLDESKLLQYLRRENSVVLSASSRTIFDKKTIERFPYIFNFHHGDLRKYRGSNIHYWAIMNEEKEFTVTLHKIEEKLDAGNVVFEESFKVDEGDTAKSLYDKSNLLIKEISRRFFIKLEEEGIEKMLRKSYSVELGKNYKRKDLNVEKVVVDMNQPIRQIMKQVRALYFPDYRNKIIIEKLESGMK